MEMIDKVARALADCPETQESDTLYYPFERRVDDYRALARAAIEAMRGPGEAMKERAIVAVADRQMTTRSWLNVNAEDMGIAFDAMLDAALTEPAPSRL